MSFMLQGGGDRPGSDDWMGLDDGRVPAGLWVLEGRAVYW
jgi:hypothetical protein